MMTINTVSMESKALQMQLTGKQQNLNKLSSDAELTASDKEKERRKINREIAELNRKLRQEQLKEQEEKFQAAGQLALAKEYAQIYRIILELFDKFVELLRLGLCGRNCCHLVLLRKQNRKRKANISNTCNCNLHNRVSS